jgi:hypothetical protein|tara:strand:- start:3703 stop:4818 length:1116 start_codon:yes stop_codon:yes gene_type:complete
MSKIVDYLKRYNPKTYPVSKININFLDDEYQDSSIRKDDILRNNYGEKGANRSDDIININEVDNINYNRQTSLIKYFLDGTRRAYYVCDIATGDGSIVPIISGQISSAVLQRDNIDGKVSLYKHYKKGLLLIPKGGGGINDGDADDIKKHIDTNYEKYNLEVAFVKIKKFENPKDNSIAKLNAEMQNLEIDLLGVLTNCNALSQDSMIIVDGALQFQNIKKENLNHLRHAIGISKHFNIHLTNVIGKNTEIGSHLINLKKVGDRTIAYRLKLDNGNQYAFWYLRIYPLQYLNYPFAGIIKIEKTLINDDEKEDGLNTDEVNNISKCLLLEKTVSTYGLDKRWASHIYPVYLTETIQKNKFISDYIFRSLFV